MRRPPLSTMIVAGLCLATLIVHLAIARHHERRLMQLNSSTALHSPLIGMDPPLPDEVLSSLPNGGPPRLLEGTAFDFPVSSPDGPADALRPASGESAESAEATTRPLTKRQQEEQTAVRAVIEEEMLETSAEERDIWFDELKSLPAEVVRDLLQVRKQLRVLSPDHALSGPSPLQSPAASEVPAREWQPRPREVTAEPVVQSRTLRSGEWISSRQAVEQAHAWSVHNLANVATPGYKRIEVLLGDVYTSGPEAAFPVAGQGIVIRAIRIHPQTGELKATQRELDLAIDGEGWFPVKDPDQEGVVLTRSGLFRVNAERKLCVSAGDNLLPLTPEMEIPAEAVSLKIMADGTISVRTPQAETPVPVGRLPLAHVLDAAILTPLGHALYAVPAETTVLTGFPDAEGLGVIRQGFLEQSNVDLDEETSQQELWKSILAVLPPADVPRTARESSRSPN